MRVCWVGVIFVLPMAGSGLWALVSPAGVLSYLRKRNELRTIPSSELLVRAIGAGTLFLAAVIGINSLGLG